MDDNNINLQIFEQLTEVFQNPGMKLNVESVVKWLTYNYETKEDVTYEDYLGIEVKPKFSVPTLSLKSIGEGLDIIKKIRSIKS